MIKDVYQLQFREKKRRKHSFKMHFKGFKSIADTCSIFLAILQILRVVLADHDGSDDPLDWLRESIPGEPGVDYPIFSEIETTSFSCKDRVFGGKFFIA